MFDPCGSSRYTEHQDLNISLRSYSILDAVGTKLLGACVVAELLLYSKQKHLHLTKLNDYLV